MRVIYKGKFKEDLNDYIQEQPWMFELDGNGQSFWELPLCMQWGVVQDFAQHIDAYIEATYKGVETLYGYTMWDSLHLYIKDEDFKTMGDARFYAIKELQKWYNENE